MDYLNGPIVSTVLSTIVVSVIAYLVGRLRSVSLKLQVIPSLQENQAELKKNIEDLKQQSQENTEDINMVLARNTEELRKQLEKMDIKVDRRFDSLTDEQRKIERDTNEKILNLIYTLRNYSDNYGSGSNSRSGSPVKYKE